MIINSTLSPQFESEVLIELVDVDTGNVIHSQTERNILTTAVYSSLMTGNALTSSPRIWISERRIAKNATVVNIISAPFFPMTEVATQTPTVFARVIPKTLSTPYLVEYKGQFNPQPTTRTLWTVGLSADGSVTNTIPLSIVALTTPCTQAGTIPGPGAVLVVTYRIQILAPVAQVNTISPAKSIDRVFAERLAGGPYSADGATSLHSGFTTGGTAGTQIAWNNVIPDNFGVFIPGIRYGAMGIQSGVQTATVANGWEIDAAHQSIAASRFRYGCTTFTLALSNTQAIGTLIGSVYNGRDNEAGGTFPLSGSSSGLMFAGVPAVRTGWQPVQTVFSHSVSGTEPFQEVAALATGTGIVNADGTNWTNPDWPKYYRISVNSTGNIGVARYSFSQRSTVGFTNNAAGTGSNWGSSATPVGGLMPIKSNITLLGGVYADNATITKSHHTVLVHPSTYAEATKNLESLAGGKVLTWDTDGVTQYDIKANQYRCWDNLSLPALPVTSIRQCSYQSTGVIWVACANTGLWRISADGNTVTNYITFGAINTSNVYGVDVGINNTVVVLVNGGIVTSTNSGSSWTTQPFTYPGISNSNWSTVYWIRVQKNSPTLRLALAQSINLGSTGTIVWWSTAAEAAVQGPTPEAGSFSGTVGSMVGTYIRDTRILTVATTGNMWRLLTNSSRGLVRWGSTVIVSVDNGTQEHARTASDMVYDYYGTPYATAQYTNTSNIYGYRLIDDTGWSSAWLTSWGSGQVKQNTFANLGNGVYLARNNDNANLTNAGFTLTVPSPNIAGLVGSNTPRGNRNLQHSILEEIVWKNFQWNGTNWVDGYHAPAIDTAGATGGPFSGTRHLFDVESHTFTGRSCIVVPTAPLTTFFTTNLTFAVQSTNLAPLSGQTLAQQLMSWVDTTTGITVQFYINNGFGFSSLIVSPVGATYLNNVSDTSTIMGTGARTFTVEPSLGYTAGMRLRFITTRPGEALPAYMEGTVTSYTGTTLVMNIENTTGSLTAARWIILFAGVQFGVTPTLGSARNVVLVINGTTAQMFSAGVQIGSNQTIPSINFGSATAELVIGGNRVQSVDGVGFDKAIAFYRGTLVNAVLDSTAWNSGNISDHNAAPTTYTTATTRIQYLLTNSLAALETKATHANSQPMLDGLTTRFTDGVGTSFVVNESYTFGVFNGILKDNATSLTHTFPVFMLPVEHGFTTLDSASVPAGVTTVTEKVCFKYSAETQNTSYTQPGYFPVRTGNNVHSVQSTAADFTYTAVITNDRLPSDGVDSAFSYFCVNDSKTVFSAAGGRWAIRIDPNASKLLQVYHQTTLVATGSIPWVVGDVLTIQRIGDVFTFRHNATVLFTTTGVQNSANRVWFGAFSGESNIMGTGSHTITYQRPANVMAIGSLGALTGKYDPLFHNIMAVRPTDLTVSIAGYGSLATVTVAGLTDTVDTFLASPPALNNVIIIPEAGYLVFNSGDSGKNVTLDCSVIKFNY